MRSYRAGTSRQLRGDSKTIPLEGNRDRGNGEDAGIWYKCWNCGFICKEGRDSLGGSESRSGVVLEDFVETPDRMGVDGKNGNHNSYQLCFDGLINHFHVVMANDSGGNPKKPYHALRVSESSSGCPFCHSKNWRGDY